MWGKPVWGNGSMGVFGNKKAVYNAIKTCIVESGYEIENNFIAYSKFCRKLEYYIDLEASSIYFQVEMFRLNNF